MSLPEPVTYLHPPRKSEAKELLLPMLIGNRYLLKNQQPLPDHALHGLIGDYRVSTHAAEIVPLNPSVSGETACYFWDADYDLTTLAGRVKLQPDSSERLLSACRLLNNRLELNQATLDGPKLSPVGDGAVLSLSARFDFTFSTDAFAAQLGMLHLVQANRFVTLENGMQITLLGTGDEDEPVLYLDKAHAIEPMAWLATEQQAKQSNSYAVSTSLSQAIPTQVNAQAVASVTVLERYCSYLMQRASTTATDQTIWTPVFAPISWGWSIRVACRSDGDWAIMRRKVMLPTTGHDGLQLPLWNNNSLACSKALETGA